MCFSRETYSTDPTAACEQTWQCPLKTLVAFTSPSTDPSPSLHHSCLFRLGTDPAGVQGHRTMATETTAS